MWFPRSKTGWWLFLTAASPRLSLRQQKTMTDKAPKSWGKVCVTLHRCSAVLGLRSPLVLTPCRHFGCWTRFHVAATITTALTAQPCSTRLHLASFGSAGLGLCPASPFPVVSSRTSIALQHCINSVFLSFSAPYLGATAQTSG